MRYRELKIICISMTMLLLGGCSAIAPQNESAIGTNTVERITIEELSVPELSPIIKLTTVTKDHFFYENFGVEEFYTLQNTYEVNVNHDVDNSTADTSDIIEVYTGNVGDGDLVNFGIMFITLVSRQDQILQQFWRMVIPLRIS